MQTSKSKIQITNGKTPSVKLGASTSTVKTSSAIAPSKKDYSKKSKKTDAQDFGDISFGQTGLTGES